MKENDDDVKRVCRKFRMILAGDIGATKTLLGLFDAGMARPRPRRAGSFITGDYPNLSTMVDAFLGDGGAGPGPVQAACFGAAGPVLGGSTDMAQLTNLAWHVDGSVVAARLGLERVSLLNDLQAMACSIPVLEESEVLALQPGTARPEGNMALIAAGTGLGEALLYNVEGRFIPMASEGGHADFAARNAREIRVLHWLREAYGRAEIEQVVSGSGLLNLYRVSHWAAPCPAVEDVTSPVAPAAITEAALEGRCSRCREALEIFVEAYGAEAGNLALRTLATGGIFLGGGIAPKILPALTEGSFMRAFRSKAPFERLLTSVPVKVILNSQAGLLGAAVHAAEQVRRL